MKKKITALALALAFAFAMFCPAGLRGMTAYAATSTPYYNWKQGDSQWGGKYIGNGTISWYGCAATSVAMLIAHSGLRSESNFDPGSFVDQMKSVGGFTGESGNYICWDKASNAVPGFNYAGQRTLSGSKDDKIANLRDLYNQGYYMVVSVKNEGHWVAVRRISGSTVTIMDPGAASYTDLFSYDAAGVGRIILYTAPNPSYWRDGASTTPVSSDDPSNYKVPFSRALYVRDNWSINQRMHGNDVLYLQKMLQFMGYTIETDSWYGPATAAVVKRFQSDYGVTPVDGDAGPITWAALESAVAKKKQASQNTSTTTTTSVTTNTLKIVTQPTNKSAKNGESVKLSLKAEGKGLSYQWYYKKKGALLWSKWSGKTKSSVSFKMSDSWNEAQFKCTVKNSASKSITSKTVKATMFKITTQPKKQSVKKNKTAKFTIKASGINVRYQWYYKKSSASSWTKWAGKTSSSVSLKATSTWNGAKFYCLVTDDSGSSIKSSSAKLTVKK